jgi:hypothetical protein
MTFTFPKNVLQTYRGLEIFGSILVTLIYSFGFLDTPDYLNYVTDWMGQGYTFSLISDPLARVYYSLFPNDLEYSVLAVALPLLLFLYFSAGLKFYPTLMVLSMHPIIYGALVNPRFFFAVTIFVYSIVCCVRLRFVVSFILAIVSVSLHLGVGLLAPLLLFLFLGGFSRMSSLLILLLIAGLVLLGFGNLNMANLFGILEYRLEYALDEGSGQAKNYLHLYFFSIFLLWVSLSKRKEDTQDCRILFLISLLGVLVCLFSFFYYNLMLSRVLHGLSFISVCFAFRCFRGGAQKASIFLYFGCSPISLLFVYPGFYFSDYWMFGVISIIVTLILIFYLLNFISNKGVGIE